MKTIKNGFSTFAIYFCLLLYYEKNVSFKYWNKEFSLHLLIFPKRLVKSLFRTSSPNLNSNRITKNTVKNIHSSPMFIILFIKSNRGCHPPPHIKVLEYHHQPSASHDTPVIATKSWAAMVKFCKSVKIFNFTKYSHF